MTSRYALYEINALSGRFAAESGVPRGVKPSYNISPGQTVPVITNRDGVYTIERMLWGFVPEGAKNTNAIFRYKTFSARSEAIFDKPMWRSSIRTKRCLVPANGFFEWKTTGEKKPFYIHPANQSLFSFAGIYDSWVGPNNTVYAMCSIITTQTDDISGMIPHRLPVIIDPDDEAAWLNSRIRDINPLYKIMRPYPPSELTIIPISHAINSKKKNTADLIQSLEG